MRVSVCVFAGRGAGADCSQPDSGAQHNRFPGRNHDRRREGFHAAHGDLVQNRCVRAGLVNSACNLLALQTGLVAGWVHMLLAVQHKFTLTAYQLPIFCCLLMKHFVVLRCCMCDVNWRAWSRSLCVTARGQAVQVLCVPCSSKG
jgi:hypothetical protein